MKKTEAYQCEYCNKLYSLKNSCRSHENKCYFNPKTRSCASCALFTQQTYQLIKFGHFTILQTCFVNINVLRSRLKTKCDNYCERGNENPKLIKEILLKYKPIEFAKKYNKLTKEPNLIINLKAPIEISYFGNEDDKPIF